MGLFRLMFWVVAMAAVAWFSTTVKLGDKTLFQHVVAIGSTPEAKDLAKGTEQEAQKVVEQVQRDLRTDGGARRK